MPAFLNAYILYYILHTKKYIFLLDCTACVSWQCCRPTTSLRNRKWNRRKRLSVLTFTQKKKSKNKKFVRVAVYCVAPTYCTHTLVHEVCAHKNIRALPFANASFPFTANGNVFDSFPANRIRKKVTFTPKQTRKIIYMKGKFFARTCEKIRTTR